ncbi:MAG TPA: bifunctional lysylphosphatidylglycerol flippase/synthetase MprF [Bacillales bacterium]|nr:bifunctional lysylphosphatidylglycerol flippase/synthetase MprF [Bacillales bacterium]
MKTIRPFFRTIWIYMNLYKLLLLRILVPIAVVLLLLREGHSHFASIDIAEVYRELKQLRLSGVMELLFFALFSVTVMSGYDLIIRSHYRLEIPTGKLLKYSWIANTFNNFVSFAGIAGAGVRTLLYKKQHVPAKKMIIANLLLAPSVVTGLSMLAWLDLLNVFPVHRLINNAWMLMALVGMALYLPFYLLVQRTSFFSKWLNNNHSRTSWRTLGGFLAVSFVEWLLAGTVFWVTSVELGTSIPLLTAIGVFSVAAVAGIISLAPGGIGSFDLTLLLGLHLSGVDPALSAAVLVLFRLFYFVVPWMIGIGLSAQEMAPSREKFGAVTATIWESSLNRWQRFWSWPGQYRLLSDIGVLMLALLVFGSGFVLLLSAATPGLLYRLKFTEQLVTLPVMALSYQMSVIIGMILIVLARGIKFRVKRAYRATVVLLIAGAVFTFVKAFDFEEALFLMIVLLLLWISRERFYREAAPVSWKSSLTMISFTLLSTVFYLWIGLNSQPDTEKSLPPNVIARYFVQPNEYFVSGAVAALAVFAFIGTWVMFRPKREVQKPFSTKDAEEVQRFFRTHKGNALSHLLYLRDKSLFWAQDGNVLIPYGSIRDKLVVLGDPLGPRPLLRAAIEEFYRFADRYAMIPVFYQVTPEHLPIYHDTGFRFFKLGEEAFVDLRTFTIKGRKNADLRNARNRFEREGYLFEVVEPPFSETFFAELKRVSDAWLGGRQEKGFSLGAFDRFYVEQGPITLIRDALDRIVAFTTIMPHHGDPNVLSVDLMRHLPDAPNGTMDVLFIKLFEWARERGCETFNLGMAPLANVGGASNAMRGEKMARFVFQYGSHWYGFEGLRRFKEKFNPHWEPRFMAYPPSVSLPIVLVDLVRLISRR